MHIIIRAAGHRQDYWKGNALLLSAFFFRSHLSLTANLCALLLSANKQVRRDFYLADERKWWNEKMEMERGMGKTEMWGEMRGTQGNKEGVPLERSSWPSLNYITEMLQHWWHRRAGKAGLALGMMSLITNQRTQGRPAPEAEI